MEIVYFEIVKYDLQRHYGGLEHSNADMTDFRRPAYSVRHTKSKYSDTHDMSARKVGLNDQSKDRLFCLQSRSI